MLFVVSGLQNFSTSNSRCKGNRHTVVAIEPAFSQADKDKMNENPDDAVNPLMTGTKLTLAAAHAFNGAEDVILNVPTESVAQLSDAVMQAGRQAMPLNVSPEDLALIDNIYSQGPDRWALFIDAHVP